jgi:hypothetical protein
MLLMYSSFWVIPRLLNFICRRFGTLCQFHLHTWRKLAPPKKMEEKECSEITYTAYEDDHGGTAG